MKSEVIVLAVKGYNFANEQGEVIQGLKFIYYAQSDLMPKDKGLRKGTKEINRGSVPIEVTLAYTMKDKIKSVPGLYLLDYEMDGNSDGKPVIDILDLEYKGVIDAKLATASK